VLSGPFYTQAASVHLSWDRNPAPDIGGYRIYFGTESGRYPNIITLFDSAVDPDRVVYSVHNLKEDNTYFFAVTAFNYAGQESGFSSEVSVFLRQGTEFQDADRDAPHNYIKNGGFEYGWETPDGWEIFDWVPEGREANTMPGMWTAREALSGDFSLKLNNETRSNIGWKGEIVIFEVPYPRTIEFGGWSKALDVSPGCLYSLDLMVVYEDGSRQWYYSNQLSFSHGTHQWQLRHMAVPLDMGVQAVQPFVIMYGCTGTAWFDDITLHVVDE